MILVTTSINDKPLARALGESAQESSIPYGDVCFYGQWHKGKTVAVCGDRKKMNDFLSCVESGHHVQQVQDASTAGIDMQFVVWERDRPMRPNPKTGFVQLYKYKFGWSDRLPLLHINRVDAYVNELEWYWGVRVIETRSLRETVRRIRAVYQMFQESPEKHHALDLFYNPPPGGVQLVRPPLVRRMAKELSGIGWERSKAVASRFKTPREMVMAGVKEWGAIPGIGVKTASSVVKELG